MSMKRNRLPIFTLCLILFAGWLFIDANRLFADTYYIRIPGVETTEQDGTGYVYQTIGYDEDRKKRALTFTSDSRLAEGEFVQLYVRDEGTVVSYEIADERDVPVELKREQAGEVEE